MSAPATRARAHDIGGLSATLTFGCDPPRSLLRLAGDLERDMSSRVEEALGYLRGRGCLELALDLEGVTFVSIPVLRVLEAERAHLAGTGGAMVCLAAPDSVAFVSQAAGFIELAALARGLVPWDTVTGPPARSHARASAAPRLPPAPDTSQAR